MFPCKKDHNEKSSKNENNVSLKKYANMQQTSIIVIIITEINEKINCFFCEQVENGKSMRVIFHVCFIYKY